MPLVKEDKKINIFTPGTWWNQRPREAVCIEDECEWTEVGIDTIHGTRKPLYDCRKCGRLARDKVV